MELSHRRVRDDEVDAALAVLAAVAAWLAARGRRQRIAATDRSTYAGWQAEGANHFVLAGDEVAGVFSLVREPLRDWPQVAVRGPVAWLRALATHPSFRGRGVGAYGIQAALRLVAPGEALYLDCVSDFLPDYYAGHGFATVSRQVRAYPGQGSFDITLMRRTA